MRILHLVEFYSPSVGGAQECVKQISERLVENGHSVSVFTSGLDGIKPNEKINGVSVTRFDVSGNAVRGLAGKDQQRFKQALVDGSFDVVMCYAAQQWTFDLLNQVIDKLPAKKVLVPCGFSGLNDPAYEKYFKDLPVLLSKYDQLVLLSETYQDAEFIRSNGLTKTTLIPNCADEKEFSSTLSPNKIESLKKTYGLHNKVICTIGGFTGLKGQMETMAVFKRLPISNCSLVVIGNNDFNPSYFESCQKFATIINDSSSSKNVVLLEMGKDIDRKKTVELLKLSDLFLFMSYIEASPLVIFEAMAAGTTFVSTRVGNVTEIIRWTKAGLSIGGKKDTDGMFHGNKLSALLKSSFVMLCGTYRRRLARRGKKAFETKFNWQDCSKMYEELYRSLTS